MDDPFDAHLDDRFDHRSRIGALVAYAYELIDRGPEFEREALVTMICERVLALVGVDVAALWMIDEGGHSAGKLVTAAENAMKGRKQERKRSQGDRSAAVRLTFPRAG